MKNFICNDVLSIGQAAKVLGVHPETLRNWHRQGLLEPYKTIGGHRRYSKAEIERLMYKKVSLSTQTQFTIKQTVKKS